MEYRDHGRQRLLKGGGTVKIDWVDVFLCLLAAVTAVFIIVAIVWIAKSLSADRMITDVSAAFPEEYMKSCEALCPRWQLYL